MVRRYQRRSEKVSGATIRAAIRYYETCGNQRETATKFGLTRSLFQKYLKGDEANIPNECSQGRFKPIFSMDQEEEIISYVNDIARRFYAMTRQSLGDLAYSLVVQNNIPHTFKNGTAGVGWINSFLMRHSDRLSLRTGTPTSLARITAFSQGPVYRFFDLLEDAIASMGFNAETIFNMDESGVKIVAHKQPRRIAPRGIESVPVVVAAERGQLCTVICSFSANGRFIPPMFIFPQSARYICMDEAPPFSIYQHSKSGWSNSGCFLSWIKHFRKFATEDVETRVLLILDNHASHINYEAVKYCSTHNIELLTLPPHSTHKLQPLDVSFFGPLKSKWASYLTKWHSEHMHQKPSVEDIPALFGLAFRDVAKRETAINGFRKTGIWQQDPATQEWKPNRHLFDDDFLPDDPADPTSSQSPPAPPQDPPGGPPDDNPPYNPGSFGGHIPDIQEAFSDNMPPEIPDSSAESRPVGTVDASENFTARSEDRSIGIWHLSREPFTYSGTNSEPIFNYEFAPNFNYSFTSTPSRVSLDQSLVSPYHLPREPPMETPHYASSSSFEIRLPLEYQPSSATIDKTTDREVKIKCQKKRSKSATVTQEAMSSSDDDDDHNEGVHYSVEMVEDPEDFSKHMLVGEQESLEDIEHVDAIILSPKGVSTSMVSQFKVGPKDIEAQMQKDVLPSTSTRKPRQPQQAEHLTSKEILNKLKSKELDKKRKKTSSDSDERRITRSTTQTERLSLRSGKRV